VLLKIVEKLPRINLLKLSLVNKRLKNLLNQKTYQILYEKKLGPLTYPPLLNFDWLKLNVYSEYKYPIDYKELKGHIGCIDSILIYENKYLASGSRDRSITLWNLETNEKILNKQGAHLGWIWAIKENDNNLVTAGWDCYVKIWDKSLNFIQSYKSESACICLSVNDNFIVTGGFNGKCHAFDKRCKNEIFNFKSNKKSVLDLTCFNNFIITAGEDGFIHYYCTRNNKQFKQIKVLIYLQRIKSKFNSAQLESRPSSRLLISLILLTNIVIVLARSEA